ncbi:MAG TPA: PPC domain-containing protein [Clostridia bacterium]|nr:PPC domain-containing protein [Clostridia bacterium]
MTSRLFACAILLLILCLTACENSQGTVTEKADNKTYALEFSGWTAERTYRWDLQQGDTLQVKIDPRGGDIRLDIRDENGTEAYTGNGMNARSFTVGIPETGTYRVTVSAQNAEGSVRIEKASSTDAVQ